MSRYGDAILGAAVREIALLKEGSRNMDIARICYRVGGYVGSGEIHRDTALQALTEAARVVGGRDGAEMASTARRAVLAGAEAPLQAPETRGRRERRPMRPRYGGWEIGD